MSFGVNAIRTNLPFFWKVDDKEFIAIYPRSPVVNLFCEGWRFLTVLRMHLQWLDLWLHRDCVRFQMGTCICDDGEIDNSLNSASRLKTRKILSKDTIFHPSTEASLLGPCVLGDAFIQTIPLRKLRGYPQMNI